MTKSRKVVLLIVFLFVIVQAILIGSCIVRGMRFERGFGQVKEGEQKEEVIDLMGEASEIKRCNSPFGQSAGKFNEYPSGNCYEVDGYFTVSQYWAIAFDKDGKVIKKYRWTFDDGYGKPSEFDFPITLW